MNRQRLRWIFVLCFLSGAAGGLTSTLVQTYLPAITKSLTQTHKDSISALINASHIYGMLAGGILLGFVSDRKGRKTGVLISTILIGLFTLCTPWFSNWILIAVFRFLAGMGVGGILLTTTILIAEVWDSSKKDIALGVLSICFPIGIFSAGIITYNIGDWRKAFWVGLLPLLLAALMYFVVKESDSWEKIKKGITQPENTETRTLLPNIILGSLIYGTMLIGLWAVFAWLPTWVQSKVPEAIAQKAAGISMMLFAAGGLSGGLISGWLSKIMGLRNALLMCFGGTFILAVILFRFTDKIDTLAYMNMGFIAIFFGISQGVLNSFIPGLFTTANRSMATGICFNISRIFTATVVFFIGWLVNVLQGYGNALFCFSFVFLVGLIVTYLYHPKTNQ